MRPLWACLLWLAGEALPASAAEQVVTILTDDNYPPYSYMRQGQAVGIYNDILRAASPLLRGYRIELKPVPWKRGLAALEYGEALALSPPYYLPQLRPYIHPYSLPLLHEQVAVYCRADVLRQARTSWPENFRGLAFGNNAGFRSGGAPFWNEVRQGRIKLEEAPDLRSNLLKMLNHRIDCYINDQLAIRMELARLEAQGRAFPGELLPGPLLEDQTAHIGYTNRDQGRFPYKDDFIRQLNQALARLERQGIPQRLVEQALATARSGLQP